MKALSNISRKLWAKCSIRDELTQAKGCAGFAYANIPGYTWRADGDVHDVESIKLAK